MRGSHRLDCVRISIAGIIPAHAGLTYEGDLYVFNGGDHPRACGAHPHPSTVIACCTGSSPRMRGSRRSIKALHRLLGIIPAHAGLTDYRQSIPRRLRDHPRACGAHGYNSRSPMFRSGSSPRMRGSHVSSALSFSSVGIIPAHAGLTKSSSCRTALHGDHPRACGAHRGRCWRDLP